MVRPVSRTAPAIDRRGALPSDSWSRAAERGPETQGPAVRNSHLRHCRCQLRSLSAGIARTTLTGAPGLAGEGPSGALPGNARPGVLHKEINPLCRCLRSDGQWSPSGCFNADPQSAKSDSGLSMPAAIADGRKVGACVNPGTLNFASGYAYWPHVDKSSVLFRIHAVAFCEISSSTL